MAQITTLQPYGLPGILRSFSAKAPAGVGYTAYGMVFLYSATNWKDKTFHLEVYWRSTTGTVYARLYNITDSAVVADSTLTTMSGSFIRSRSTALSLTDGKEYRIQFGKVGGDGGEFLGGKLIAA